jgi:hypothetical protein
VALRKIQTLDVGVSAPPDIAAKNEFREGYYVPPDPLEAACSPSRLQAFFAHFRQISTGPDTVDATMGRFLRAAERAAST